MESVAGIRHNRHLRVLPPLRTKAQRLARTGAIAASVVIVLLLAGTAALTLDYLRAETWVAHTTEVIEQIREARSMLPGTQALSGSALRVKVAAILRQFDAVEDLTRDNSRQMQSAADFRAVFLAPAPANTAYRTNFEAQDIATADAILDHMQHEEEMLLIQRVRVQSAATRNGAMVGLALLSALLLLGLGTGLALGRELEKRARADQALMEERDELTEHTRELAMVSAGSRMLQAASDENQANDVVDQVLRDLAPDSLGYFAAVSPSNDLVEISTAWGFDIIPAPLMPSDCLALQMGRTFHRSGSPVRVECRHPVPDSGDYVCIPVLSAAGSIGVLHVATPGTINRRRCDVLEVFAAHIGLELANLRMREVLRSQTVRDPLTGVFNRRYFDETLSRELLAAERHGSTLAVLMIDVDHFKRLNDSQGHAAGDDALRIFARIMRSTFRESDVLCRYGGEEFAVILPDIDLERAFDRAERLRRHVKETEMVSGDTALGNITISIGVAVSSEFSDPDAIVRAADAALYQAKQTGRNATWACTNYDSTLPSIAKEAVVAG